MKRVTAKLGTMRKEQTFVVMPTDKDRIIVQSDKSIGVFDIRTSKGLLNQKGCYFPHLSPAMGARAYDFPAEFVKECLEVCPALDSTTELAGGAVIVYNTVKEA